MPVSASRLLDGLKIRNPNTYAHSVRVAEYAISVATALYSDPNFVMETYLAGLLHDVGKLLVSEDILSAPRNLSEQERMLVDTHAINGANMLCDVSIYIRESIGLHHTNYCNMATINYVACIIKTCDVYDALTSDRAYKKALSRKDSLSIMMKGAGTEFEPRVLNAICATTGYERRTNRK